MAGRIRVAIACIAGLATLCFYQPIFHEGLEVYFGWVVFTRPAVALLVAAATWAALAWGRRLLVRIRSHPGAGWFFSAASVAALASIAAAYAFAAPGHCGGEDHQGAIRSLAAALAASDSHMAVSDPCIQSQKLETDEWAGGVRRDGQCVAACSVCGAPSVGGHRDGCLYQRALLAIAERCQVLQRWTAKATRDQHAVR